MKKFRVAVLRTVKTEVTVVERAVVVVEAVDINAAHTLAPVQAACQDVEWVEGPFSYGGSSREILRKHCVDHSSTYEIAEIGDGG